MYYDKKIMAKYVVQLVIITNTICRNIALFCGLVRR